MVNGEYLTVSNDTSFQATKPGGSILVVGMGPPLSKVPIMEAVVKEIKIQGVFCYANKWVFLLTAFTMLRTFEGRIGLSFQSVSHSGPFHPAQRIRVKTKY